MAQLSSKWIRVSEPSAHVLHVELARNPVNAFSEEFWRAYGEVFDRISANPGETRVVVLSSTIPKLFTAGLDLNDANGTLGVTQSDPARTAIGLRQHIYDFQDAIAATERCVVPVIVAVHGLVLGLGIDIMCACDIRYAASNTSLSIKEVDIGLAADIGTLARLPKITGNQSLVRELAYTAEFFPATTAEKIGLVSKVVDGGREEVIAAALECAKKIALKSPVAVSGTKHLLTHARDHSVQENLQYTAIWNSAAVQTKDVASAMKASRAKQSSPQFTPLKANAKL